MKKLLLLAALLAMPSMVFAQGFVTFQNYTSPFDTRIQTNDLAGHIGNITGTAQWAVGLYLAPAGTADPLSASWQLVQVSTNRSGGFSGLFTAFNPLQLPNGYAVGSTYATMVRGWALAAGNAAGQVAGFQIAVVPEPSSIALGLLGLGAVALIRRRK